MRILLTVPLAVLLIGCGGAGDDQSAGTGSTNAATTSAAAPAPSGGDTVTIADFKFGAPVTVSAGTAVTWTNTDNAPHNAVGDDFKTKDLLQGDSDSVTFDEPGTYDYICTFHPFMKGTVVVR